MVDLEVGREVLILPVLEHQVEVGQLRRERVLARLQRRQHVRYSQPASTPPKTPEPLVSARDLQLAGSGGGLVSGRGWRPSKHGIGE